MAASQSALHHSVLLSNYAQDWRPPTEGYYVGPDLFPVVPVGKEFDDFMRLNASTWRQTANAVVGARGQVSQVHPFRDTDGSYKAKPYALEGVIDHKDRDAADDVMRYEQLQMDVPLVTLANTLEVDAITAATTTADLGSSYETVAADERFDNLGSLNSNPVLYIERKCRAIKRKTGFKVNRIVMDDLLWQAIKWHPTTQVFLPVHTTPAGLQLITPSMLEDKLEEVVEKGSIRITSFRVEKERAPIAPASSDLRAAIKANLIIAFVADNPSLQDWSAFKCFAWTGATDPITGATLADGNPRAPMGVYTYPKPEIGQRGSTVGRVITNRAFKVTRTDSLFVAFDAVDTSQSSLYGNELLGL